MTEETFSRGFLLLLRPGPGVRVLEASADGGARGLALRALGATPVCVRASGVDLAPLRAQGLESVAFGRLATVQGPLADAALLSVALGRTRGSEWTTDDLEGVLGVLLSALSPGAPVALSLPNPLFGWPLAGRLLERLAGIHKACPLRGGPPILLLDGAELGVRLRAAGLVDVRLFAALPDAARLKFLVPLASPAAITYFFRTLVPRPRTALRRAAVRAAGFLASSGLLGRIAPGFEVVARTRPRP